MTLKIHTSTACVTAIVLFGAAAAVAQTPQPGAPALRHGPAVPGVCILSVEGVIAESAVGAHVNTRMEQLFAQVTAELEAERTAIVNDDNALAAQSAGLDPTTLEQRTATLQVRFNAFQRKAQLRERELQATQQKAIGRIQQELQSSLPVVYQQKNCSVLLNRQAVVIGSPTMDVTRDVLAALNTKITQFAFDRERLNPQAASGPDPR